MVVLYHGIHATHAYSCTVVQNMVQSRSTDGNNYFKHFILLVFLAFDVFIELLLHLGVISW